MRIHWHGYTQAGRDHRTNEDSFLVLPEHGAAVVCDGLGGQEGGDYASQTACKAFAAYLGSGEDGARFKLDPAMPAPARRLAAAVLHADDAIRRAIREYRPAGGMGTTMVAAVVLRDQMYFAHAGDSRAYLCRGRFLHVLTHDHTVVRDLIRAGVITEAQAASVQQNSVTRALGVGERLLVDVGLVTVTPGDVITLTTDGIHGSLDHAKLAAITGSSHVAPQMCQRMVTVAVEADGLDDATAVVARVEP
jgi:protein phosphatase